MAIDDKDNTGGGNPRHVVFLNGTERPENTIARARVLLKSAIVTMAIASPRWAWPLATAAILLMGLRHE